MINIILADDQQIIREGIKMILSLYDDVRIIGEANDGKELLYLLTNLNPDVILLDVRMPNINGVDATKIIKENYKNVKVLILTSFNDDNYIFDSLKNGADGYLLKDSNSDTLIDAIRTVYNGEMLLAPEVTKKVVTAFKSITIDNTCPNREEEINSDLLTSREIDVARLISQGKSNKDICHILFLSEGTVKNYVSKILSKLNLNSRTELALFFNKYLENSSYIF